MGQIILGILLFGGVILVFREVVMWYWRINTIVYTLEQQNKILLDITEELRKNRT